MDIGAVAAAVDELGTLVRGDGAELHLIGVDTRRGLVELELDLVAAGCEDCVLPPDRLLAMVQESLQRRVPGDYRVTVDDPRGNGETTADQVQTGGATVLIVDPAAEVTTADADPGPDAGNLRGRTVGFRVDVLWRSWDWVVDEWSRALEGEGASTRQWRRAQGLAGERGQQHAGEYEQFLSSIDIAVVGLGNCGSCTSWTIKDAVSAAATGIPTVAVATEQFEALARTLASSYGRAGLRLHVLPYPLDVRPEQEVRAIARDAFPALLATLGAGV
jgi:Fe-S cluster biogenesis protein NfuA